MSNQLNAIAREYNLPSTVGLCLYLNTNQNGLALRPRITDESWSILWGIQFEARSPSTTIHLPICGQLELDIDLSKARWYDAWLGTSRRDVDVPQSVTPSRPHSVAHFRGDSRSTFVDGVADGHTDSVLTLQQMKVPAAPRMVPKKLSLVDRFDTLSSRSVQKLPSGETSPPSPTPRVQLLHALSPILQEEEPKTAKKEIDDMVKSWRASAQFGTSPLHSTGQISLDPINMPNTLEDLPTATSGSFELNLEDYTWSVSSLGPNYSSDIESCPSEDRVPSVHVDRRAVGSVALTPSVCTTFGWDDENAVFSPYSNVSRLPSPDIAGRALSDAPVTPATATSWGPPSSYLASPMLIGSYRAPSIDIARRNMHSQPVTPFTATSWGPPSYPVSPAYSQYALRPATPDLGERTLLSAVPTSSRLRRLSSHETRGSIQTWALDAADADSHEDISPAMVVSECEEPAQLYEFVFPYYHPSTGDEDSSRDALGPVPISISDSDATPWTQVWPYTKASAPGEDEIHEPGQFTAAPWTQVWPYTEVTSQRQSLDCDCRYPCFDICKPPSLSTILKVSNSSCQIPQSIHISSYILLSCARLLTLRRYP